MKKVAIDKYTLPDKDSIWTVKRKFHIKLGNGADLFFTNKVKLDTYLATTNKALTNILHETILLNIETYNQFWSVWLYFDIKSKMVPRENKDLYRELENKCINEFWHIPPKLQLAVRASSYENGNYFVFQHLRNSLDSLKFILDNTLLIMKMKLHTIEARRINLLIKEIERVKIRLENIGKDESENMNKVNSKTIQ